MNLFASVLPENVIDPPDLSAYPSIEISNGALSMLLYPPDSEKGLYRATRFDWSGVIGSVKYKGHEYFGYWKESHDPAFHEDLSGPVEGFIEPGLGYAEAAPGEGFVRLGVGVLEKADEEAYNWCGTYPILDHGKWEVERGSDFVSFTHRLETDFGYAYVYRKTVRLTSDGFRLEHSLRNCGDKPIETDQFNHNFFRIDGTRSGKAFVIAFPYHLSTPDSMKGLMEISDNELHFLEDFHGKSLFINLEGFGESPDDHSFVVRNRKSGASVRVSVDKPLYRMAFWACESTLSPENFIWISVQPGEEETWTAVYTLFEE